MLRDIKAAVSSYSYLFLLYIRQSSFRSPARLWDLVRSITVIRQFAGIIGTVLQHADLDQFPCSAPATAFKFRRHAVLPNLKIVHCHGKALGMLFALSSSSVILLFYFTIYNNQTAARTSAPCRLPGCLRPPVHPGFRYPLRTSGRRQSLSPSPGRQPSIFLIFGPFHHIDIIFLFDGIWRFSWISSSSGKYSGSKITGA